jgi:hypothetical protein
MRPRWFLLRTGLVDLGELPDWLDDDDPDSAAQQIHKHYGHGGGWHPFQGTIPPTLSRLYELCYPGDPPLMPLAGTKLRHELIFLYPHSWLAIIQPDRTFEVARID